MSRQRWRGATLPRHRGFVEFSAGETLVYRSALSQVACRENNTARATAVTIAGASCAARVGRQPRAGRLLGTAIVGTRRSLGCGLLACCFAPRTTDRPAQEVGLRILGQRRAALATARCPNFSRFHGRDDGNGLHAWCFGHRLDRGHLARNIPVTRSHFVAWSDVVARTIATVMVEARAVRTEMAITATVVALPVRSIITRAIITLPVRTIVTRPIVTCTFPLGPVGLQELPVGTVGRLVGSWTEALAALAALEAVTVAEAIATMSWLAVLEVLTVPRRSLVEARLRLLLGTLARLFRRKRAKVAAE